MAATSSVSLRRADPRSSKRPGAGRQAGEREAALTRWFELVASATAGVAGQMAPIVAPPLPPRRLPRS